ncbi:MAG TPA: hypothetical protein VF982_03530, partial [Anaerolineales bacterium]
MRALVLALAVYAPGLFAADLQTIQREAEVLAREAQVAVTQGRKLPPDLYPTINAARALGTFHSQSVLAELLERLRGYTQELTINPDLVGTSILRATPADLQVGSEAEFRLIYRVGTNLGPGAAVLAARHYSWPAPLQNVDATRANYVSATVRGRSDVTLRPLTVTRGGVHGGLFAPEPLPAFVIAEGQLRGGDEIVLRYQRVQTLMLSFNRFVLPLYLRMNPGAHWLLVPGTSLPLRSGAVTSLQAALPVIARTGETVSVQLRLADSFGNLASGTFPPFEVLVDGQFRTRVPAGSDPAPAFDLTFESSGLRLVEVRSAGGGLRTAVKVNVEPSPAFTVRWVELRAPGEASGSLLDTDEVRGRFIGVVDEVVLVNDDAHLDATSWQSRVNLNFDGFLRTADLLAGGHMLVLAPQRLNMSTPPREAWPTLGALMRSEDLLPTLRVALPGVPADPRFMSSGAVTLAEIQSGRGNFEWYGNLLAARGIRLGFTGSAVSHHAPLGRAVHNGRTAVMLKPGERLFDALRARRTYVTTGPRLLLDVSVNEGQPGERVPASELRQVKGRVIGTAGIDRIELLRNGAVIATRDLARS